MATTRLLRRLYPKSHGPLSLVSFRLPQLDPAEADYLFIPVAGSIYVRVLDAIKYVAATWPYFNASVAALVANHVVPTLCDDGGFGRCAPTARTPSPRTPTERATAEGNGLPAAAKIEQ